jgi:hypothetical protein
MDKQIKFQEKVNESVLICQELVAKLEEIYSEFPNKHISDISIKAELFTRDLKRVRRESQGFD